MVKKRERGQVKLAILFHNKLAKACNIKSLYEQYLSSLRVNTLQHFEDLVINIMNVV